MDITPYMDLKIAPRALFDALPERRTRPRFMLPTEQGDWQVVTWGELAEQVRMLALMLGSLGLGAADRAAIFAPNRVEWMSAALAVQAAGGVMVPIYPASTAEQAGYVVEHSDAKVVFVDTPALLERIFAQWPSYSAVRRVVLMDDEIDAAGCLRSLRSVAGCEAPSFGEVEPRLLGWHAALEIGRRRGEEAPGRFEAIMDSVDLDQPGLMLYTSGTTGRPKGVPLTHRNVAINGRDWLTCNASLLDEGAVDLLWLPMSHIFGFGEACLGNTLGFTSYLSDPRGVLEQLPVVRPNVFMSVPAYWEKIAAGLSDLPDADERRCELAQRTGGRLRFCLSGGAGLKREIKQLYHECGLLIIEGYGLTECSPTLTLNRPDAFRFDSVGKPLPSVELKLAGDGEILARGPSVFGGYHKDPEATREVFTADGWLRTGDVGVMTEDGFLQIVDRKKEILVTAGGKNVPPANIERRFSDDPIFEHVLVYGDGKKYLTAGVWLSHEAVERRLAAGQVVAEERSGAIEALVRSRIDDVNATLARFEQIKRFVVIGTPLTVAEGLLTSTMKVRRKKVYQAFRDVFEALYV